MPTGLRLAALLLVTALALSGCPKGGSSGPPVVDPRVGQSYFLCCNLRYEKDEISDVNYSQGTMIPFGTRVQILKIYRNEVQFQAAGFPPMTFVLKYGRDTLPMEQFFERWFVTTDPHKKLGKKVPAKRVKLIEQGLIEPGMTRDQVLMAIGYPPAHRTPSLELPQWTYWQNRWKQYVVVFDGDKVARVQY